MVSLLQSTAVDKNLSFFKVKRVGSVESRNVFLQKLEISGVDQN